MAILLMGCSAGNTVVRFSRVPQGMAPTATEIKDYPGAMRAIASAVEKELNITVSPVELTLYPNAYDFERGLVKDAGFNASFAHETVRFAWGVGGSGKILVNEAALKSSSWLKRVRFLSHEFIHTIYVQLANGMEIDSEQWLQEGFADWVSYRVLERLGYRQHRTAEESEHNAAELTHSVLRADFPAIADMQTSNEWATMRVKYGMSATYSQAFLATDYLIQKHGVRSVVKYFRLYGESSDRLRNFRESFVSDFAVFNQEFVSYMRNLPSTKSNFRAKTPIQISGPVPVS